LKFCKKSNLQYKSRTFSVDFVQHQTIYNTCFMCVSVCATYTRIYISSRYDPKRS